MTVAPTGSGEVQPYDPSVDDFGNVGLEDVDASDLVLPRLKIDHKNAALEDPLSKVQFPSPVKLVLLGQVKQRIMWAAEVDDGDKPMCKSPDFEHGFPRFGDDVPKDKAFPWAKSNFEPGAFPPESGLNGLVTLPCASCIFKEWEKGDWKQPPCSEQHTYIVLYSPSDGWERGEYQPALLTLQRTGIKPSKTYISSFAQSHTPLFTVFTEMKLTHQSRGTVDYAVPSFRRLEQTPREWWGELATSARAVRDIVRMPPRNRDEDDDTTIPESESSSSAPAQAQAAAPSSAPAPVPPAGDDDLPF